MTPGGGPQRDTEAGDQLEDMRTENLRIDCDECVMRDTDACGDCVVSFIVKREPGDAIVVERNFWNQDDIRAARQAAVERNPARMPNSERSGRSVIAVWFPGSGTGHGPDERGRSAVVPTQTCPWPA